jgi:hypothetical protein
MFWRKWFVASVLWAASLVAAGVWAHAQVIVQRPDFLQGPPVPPTPPPPPPAPPFVVSGGDVGFRVTGFRGGRPVGTWVIRTSADAQWKEPVISDQ